MGILAAMFVASLVLAVVSFVWPAPVKAEHYRMNAITQAIADTSADLQ